MERFADPVLHDERRYQAECELADRLAVAAEQEADFLMQKGERFDPFCYVHLSDFLFDSPTIAEKFGELLHAGKYQEAGELIAKEARAYIRPAAVGLAMDKIERGEQ